MFSLSYDEYKKVLFNWDEIEALSYEVKTVCQLFEENAALVPAHIAMEHNDVVLTYKELNERTNQLARYIRKEYQLITQEDLKPDTLIPISVGRGIDYIIGILAILKSGAAYVPINPDYPTTRIQFILTDINSKLILTDATSSEKMKLVDPNIKQVQIDTRLFLKEETNNLEHQINSSNLAYAIYTSGSTGTPKGVLAQHENILAQVVCASYFVADETDTITFFSDVSFDSTTFEIWGALLNRAKLFIPNNFFDLLSNPTLFKETIHQKKITIILLTRALFDLLFTLDETVFASLKYLLSGGEALTKNIMLKLVRSQYKPQHIINAYGPTENSTFCTTYNIIDDSFSVLNSVPVGTPYSNRVGYVLDRHLQLLPIGVTGEMYVGGPSLARGYLNRPDLTQERFITNPFVKESNGRHPRIYKTSDLVRWLPDGNLEYIGRNDFQVKLRGYRIELAEIETRLLEFPGIKHSVVLLKQNTSPAYLVGYYVSDQKLDEKAIRSYLATVIPDYMIPSVFIHLQDLPVTTNGKLDRKALPEPVLHSDAPSDSGASQPIEKTIQAIWSKVLNIGSFEKDESFFNLGGNSLAAMMVRKELEDVFNIKLNIVELFQYTTLRQLSEHISSLISPIGKIKNGTELNISAQSDLYTSSNEPIAIIGMACRLPGIKDPESFWELLSRGKSNLRDFSDDELRANHVDESFLASNSYVKRGAVFEDCFSFDAQFFGYSAKDAEIMDPQQRQFLECAWEALEYSGNVPEKFNGDIGVFASQGRNYYFMENVYPSQTHATGINEFQAILGNEKDFLSTRTSFKLNLTGPSITLQTACSSSLVAVQMACESLKNHGCDMALAGGVSVFYNHGYLYQEDMIESPDGYCHAFDIRARGTVVTSGVGVVVLKRLSDAIRDRDAIYAVLKGGAINNDGSSKVGYTAPSVKGQSAVIEKAIKNAGVLPETITYIETHGTGTSLGDPIEWTALHNVYEKYTDKKEFCILGSVKTNIGHTDSAAGVFGLIKTVFALKNRIIPATLNFEKLNPEIASFNTLFKISNQPIHWDSKDNHRRAAVSSFGIGGTNAHVILEEYNAIKNENEHLSKKDSGYFLIPFSAKNREALFSIATRMKDYINTQKEISLNDIAFTAQEGRTEFKERGYFLISAHKSRNDSILTTYFRERECLDKPDVIFVFSELKIDSTSQFQILYDKYQGFKEPFDSCVNLIRKKYNLNLDKVFSDDLTDTKVSKLLSFSIRYALAQLLISLKIKPESVISQGSGAYVAAAFLGDIPLEEVFDAILFGSQISSHNLKSINNQNNSLYIEIGNENNCNEEKELASCLIPQEGDCSEESFLKLVGWLWAHGLSISWDKINASSLLSRKVRMPTYVFTKKHYEIKKVSTKQSLSHKEREAANEESSVESKLKEMWGKILGVSSSEVTKSSHFFNLGGDSLAFIDLLNTIKKAFLINFKLEEMMMYQEFGVMFSMINDQLNG